MDTDNDITEARCPTCGEVEAFEQQINGDPVLVCVRCLTVYREAAKLGAVRWAGLN